MKEEGTANGVRWWHSKGTTGSGFFLHLKSQKDRLEKITYLDSPTLKAV